MLIKKFKDRVVKRMRQVPGGILLTFLSVIPGERGEQLTVTQAEWDQHGSEHYDQRQSLAALRDQQKTAA